MIQFLTVHVAEEVHAGPLGFTKTLYLHCWGSNRAEAELAARGYLRSKGLTMLRCSTATPAINQDVRRYTFPEQIYGAPPAVIEPVLQARLREGWPSSFVEQDLKTYRNTRADIQKALQELLATPA